MQRKKNISLIVFLSALNLISCSGVNASEKNQSELKSSVSGVGKPEPLKSTNEAEKSNDKSENSLISTVKKHPVVSTLVPVSAVSLAIIGGYFKFFRKGGNAHPKAKATIDAMNKLTTEDRNIKKLISDLGALGDGTVRVVVDFIPNQQLFEDWCNHVNASTDNFNSTKMVITTIITDALNTPDTEQSSTSIFKYEDRKINLNLPIYNNCAWLRMLRDCPSGDKKYSIWFGMDKNNEDLHIKIDLTKGW